MTNKPPCVYTPEEKECIKANAAIARECGGCHVCCQALAIEELHKECWTLCTHCDQGCQIYKDRPKSCRLWYCYWALKYLPETYRPDKCGFLIEGRKNLGNKAICIWETIPGTFKQKNLEIIEPALKILKRFNLKDLTWIRYGIKIKNNGNGLPEGKLLSIKKNDIDFHYYLEPDEIICTHYYNPYANG
jgi:hypothetical protein